MRFGRAAVLVADPADASWPVVDVEHVETWPRLVSLEDMKPHKEGALSEMALFKYSRLSVQPVSAAHVEFIEELAGKRADGSWADDGVSNEWHEDYDADGTANQSKRRKT